VILLDTTVLVHALGDDHALRAPCRSLIDAIGDRGLRATTTAEVIQEFVHVRSRRHGREDAAALGRRFADLLSPLHGVDEDDLRSSLDLFVVHDSLGPFDAVLAATVLRNDHIHTLVSTDRAFGRVRDLDWADPSRTTDRERLGIGGSREG
jgi:predicted nucleic acid-binding protein